MKHYFNIRKAFMFMAKKDDLDYLFIVWGIPRSNSTGAVNSQIYSLANKLVENNNKVGILYVSYDSVAKKFKMVKNDPQFRFKLILSNILYSRIASKLSLYLYKKKDGKVLNNYVRLYASGTKLPPLKADKIITSYWWAVLLADEIYHKNDIYLIVYHDYYNDIINSNRENLPALEKAYKSSHLILANQELIKKFNGDYPLITEGIDTEKFMCQGNRAKKVDSMILTPLRKNPLKGAEYAIAALKMIHNEFPEVKIVAYGDFHGNIPDFIDFKHVIPDETLKEYYCKSSYFILPSVIEGIPEPLLEAMAGGCACISTASGGPQQVINTDINGILVPIKDPESIFTAFKKLYQNRELAMSIMEHSIKTAGNFDLKRTYNDFINAVNFYNNRQDEK